MTRTGRKLWLDPIFGASGDMLLGALIGLGASVQAVRRDLDQLGLDGWSIDVADGQRASLSATRATVTVSDEPDQHHRAWSTIDRLLATSALPDTVSAGARATFRRLAEVEAGIHGVDIDEVHFHEVGAVDAIVDVVGTWSALHHLGVDEVTAGPVGLGNGTVHAAHGLLPVPAPATLNLLEGVPVHPVATGTGTKGAETVTPTGAALLVTMVDEWGPIPAGRLVGSSRGAGGRNPATHPNVITAVMVESDAPTGTATPGAAAVVLATNLDDATPEIVGHTIGRLLDAGADDAWVVPVTMKKNRPGHELRVLCSPSLTPALRHLVFAETGTLGIRTETVTKHALARTFRTVEVRGHPVRVKAGPHGAKPEHDDLVAVSEATGVAVRQLAQEAFVADSVAPSVR